MPGSYNPNELNIIDKLQMARQGLDPQKQDHVDQYMQKKQQIAVREPASMPEKVTNPSLDIQNKQKSITDPDFKFERAPTPEEFASGMMNKNNEISPEEQQNLKQRALQAIRDR